MKTKLVILLAVCCFNLAGLQAQHADNKAKWLKIDSLESEGLPKSALTIVDGIFKQAQADKNYPQFIKSLIFKMRYRTITDYEFFDQHLKDSERLVDSVSFPVKPILHSMIAEMYWWYIQNNRYKLYGRSNTTQFVPDDLATWDLARLTSKVVEHYQLSLKDDDLLKMIDLRNYQDILTYYRESDIPDHPTLYDFLAMRAFNFFKNEESGLTKPEEEFSMNNEDFFLPADSFIKLPIKTPDTTAFKYHAITLLQHMISFHLNDSLPGELVTTDLMRLAFVNQYSTSSKKDSLYLKALYFLEKRSTGDFSEAKVGIAIAEKVYSLGELYNPRTSEVHKWDKKKALEKSETILKKYPDARSQCKNFKAKVEYPDISITMEKENLPDQPFRALLAYQNMPTVFVRVIQMTYKEFDNLQERYQKQQQEKYIQWEIFLLDYLKAKKAVSHFSVSLSNDGDYQKHFTEIKIPALSKGLYYVLASASDSMDYTANHVAYGITAVTNISYIHQRNTDGSNDFYVLNRETGLPLAGVTASCMVQQYEEKTRRYISILKKKYTTDADGLIHSVYKDFNQGSYWVEFRDGDDVVTTRDLDNQYNGSFYNYERDDDEDLDTRTFFFTDRAIYRPGQTIYFKGIMLETDGKKKNKLLTKRNSTVRLYNTNHQEVSHLDVTTNEFGSFSGTFTAPSSGLNGNMTIEGEDGDINISVEDYKRPKFEVKYDTLKASYKLGQMVTVKGYAKAYSGASIDNAAVKYRVVRKVRYSWWWDEWWNPRPQSADKEIAHGTVKSGSDGTFEVNFKAFPDESIAPSTNPTFTYEIGADVTDVNGETHSGKTQVSIGYKALLVNAVIPGIVEKSQITDYKLSTTNQNGDFVAATGKLTVYKLTGPDKVYRNRLWEKPDKQLFTKQEYNRLFPFDQYEDELKPSTWASEKMVYAAAFNTALAKTIKFPKMEHWTEGMYKLMIESKDAFGEPVQQTSYFTLLDKQDLAMPYLSASSFIPVKNTAEPGEDAEILYGSAYQDESKALIEVEVDRKIVAREWHSTGNSLQLYTHRIKEEYRGNIGIHYALVKHNRLYTSTALVRVPYTNKELDIQFETFRNKLQPGEKDEWKLRIKGKAGEKQAAEMVATLYDASLDAFRPQSFNFSIWPEYSPQMGWTSPYSFTSVKFRNYIQRSFYFGTDFPSNNYALDWFGFGYQVSYRPFHHQDEWNPEPGKSSFKIISSVKQKGSEVSGTIYDASTNEPLIGVSVQIEGTSTGTLSDANGKFKLSSDKENITLVFSFIGYLTEKVSLKSKGKVKLLVKLAPDVQRLEEVVVVGYGVQKKKDLTGSVMSVKSAAIMYKESKSVDDAKVDDKLVLTQSKSDLSTVQARTNLNETAFFYPHLQTDEHDDVLISFTIPEALTRWKMLGFAHTKDLAYGFTENELVTQKELMVTPNAPRFFRENDTITFTAKITSLSDKDLTGNAQLMLFDALTMKPADVSMHNFKAQQSFAVKKGESTNLNWEIIIPTGLQVVTYRVVAKAGKFSDGEESTLPVLTNSMLVTETLPLPVKGKQTKTFTLDKLVHNTSTTLRNHKLTLEYTSNPAWYAIQALPYLMEYPYECAEQTFSRFYANSIASNIANSSPRIKQVFDSWKNITPDALLSNLEKNQELKGLILEETPWVWAANDESQRKRNVALLFDLNRMADELGRALDKLQKMQLSNGGFPWFQGLPDDRYITQYIICGMGKLDHLGVKNIREDGKTWNMVTRAISYTDDRIYEDYRQLVNLAKAGKLNLSDDHLGYTAIHYLYTRSFFTDVAMNANTKEALNYYLGQARKYWLTQGTYMQSMISLSLSRYKDVNVPARIIKSFKERSIISEEMGMYWKYDAGWFWYQAPIETQALMIEAFDEVSHDTTAVNEMKVWLLKQKQTQDWRTTKATAEACYALLLRGSDWLTNDQIADISVGNHKVDPPNMPEVKVEAGTGYFKTSWNGSDITPEMGKVTISKKDNGVSWGALYWQYFEQLDKITSAETPLKLKKQLFMERNTSSGPVIQLISDSTHLKPGDLLKVRIELRVDREMEYVHMKDMRASGLEPTNVLSSYKYQDGLWYYESTRDAATNFFFGWLPKGTYVFEYPLRVTHYGNFSNGITTIQSMYAPEFTSHSEGVRVKVK